jgi:hypothetical protein
MKVIVAAIGLFLGRGGCANHLPFFSPFNETIDESVHDLSLVRGLQSTTSKNASVINRDERHPLGTHLRNPLLRVQRRQAVYQESGVSA